MDYDLIIIGAGPAGYVAAIRAGQTGLKTAIIEKTAIGGMCLNWGCIPSKAIIESAKRFDSVKDLAAFGVDGIDPAGISFNWKNAKKRSTRIVRRLTKGVEFLLKKNGVEILNGTAHIKTATSVIVDDKEYSTSNIIIATGAIPATLPFAVPEDIIIPVKDLFGRVELLAKPVVVGLNAHAIELAQFFNLIGSPVTLIVPGEKLLPDVDAHLADYVDKAFRKAGINIHYSPEIKGFENGQLRVNDDLIDCDGIINASQRNAIVPSNDLKLELDNGFINVNENLQSNIDNIFAVGDVNGKSKYAHTASAQGLHAVNFLNGIKQAYDFTRYPINIYTKPEIAQIGLTELEIKKRDIDCKVTEFPLTANGKALTEGNNEGFIRLLSEKQYGEVLGVQIVAANATDMIAEASVLLQLESTIYDVASAVHAHPTVSEVYMESGFAAFDQPIHK